MANEVGISASSFLAVFGVLVTLVACMAEEKSVFLVLMDGEPVAFHGGHSSEKGRILKMNRYNYICLVYRFFGWLKPLIYLETYLTVA